MSTFFRGITEAISSLFRGIFSERNSVANPGEENDRIKIADKLAYQSKRIGTYKQNRKQQVGQEKKLIGLCSVCITTL
jgi:hypothetical protein